MTNLRISSDCITNYFDPWRKANSDIVRTIKIPEHQTISAAYKNQSTANSSRIAYKNAQPSLDPGLTAISAHSIAEFYRPLDPRSDQMRLLERVPFQPDSEDCENLPYFELLVKSLSEYPESCSAKISTCFSGENVYITKDEALRFWLGPITLQALTCPMELEEGVDTGSVLQ
ncbi:hypothetical protein DSL72_000780 [Monilinia vaccinii-corymbosi]|uniref:Uncharacterized protein n=1 Tax=Monilinia vaccinii-corymbosi TaxID=61207 RepID=A0A8A3PAF0_9HELO|nr:hypothetical protein DSL72_000780 [Monilinia vaccinii-corymbosi]